VAAYSIRRLKSFPDQPSCLELESKPANCANTTLSRPKPVRTWFFGQVF
jgi:hypothetical protein